MIVLRLGTERLTVCFYMHVNDTNTLFFSLIYVLNHGLIDDSVRIDESGEVFFISRLSF